jgi:hypothetical protein
LSITINADDLRSIRAVEIAATASQWLTCPTADGEQAYRIPSQWDPDRAYVVTAAQCDCPDFQRKGLPPAPTAHESGALRACKHMLAVRLYNELVRAQRNLIRSTSQRR